MTFDFGVVHRSTKNRFSFDSLASRPAEPTLHETKNNGGWKNERERETKTKNKQINLILCHLKEEMYRKGETETLRQR